MSHSHGVGAYKLRLRDADLPRLLFGARWLERPARWLTPDTPGVGPVGPTAPGTGPEADG